MTSGNKMIGIQNKWRKKVRVVNKTYVLSGKEWENEIVWNKKWKSMEWVKSISEIYSYFWESATFAVRIWPWFRKIWNFRKFYTVISFITVIYDWAHKPLFRWNTKTIQYDTGLATTGVLRESTWQKNSQKLDFKSLQQRSWYRKLCYLFIIIYSQ